MVLITIFKLILLRLPHFWLKFGGNEYFYVKNASVFSEIQFLLSSGIFFLSFSLIEKSFFFSFTHRGNFSLFSNFSLSFSHLRINSLSLIKSSTKTCHSHQSGNSNPKKNSFHIAEKSLCLIQWKFNFFLILLIIFTGKKCSIIEKKQEKMAK